MLIIFCFLVSRFVYISLLVAAAIYVAVVVAPHPRQLVSFLGMFLFFSLMFLFSKHPGKVCSIQWFLSLCSWYQTFIALTQAAVQNCGLKYQPFLCFPGTHS